MSLKLYTRLFPTLGEVARGRLFASGISEKNTTFMVDIAMRREDPQSFLDYYNNVLRKDFNAAEMMAFLIISEQLGFYWQLDDPSELSKKLKEMKLSANTISMYLPGVEGVSTDLTDYSHYYDFWIYKKKLGQPADPQCAAFINPFFDISKGNDYQSILQYLDQKWILMTNNSEDFDKPMMNIIKAIHHGVPKILFKLYDFAISNKSLALVSNIRKPAIVNLKKEIDLAKMKTKYGISYYFDDEIFVAHNNVNFVVAGLNSYSFHNIIFQVTYKNKWLAVGSDPVFLNTMDFDGNDIIISPKFDVKIWN